MASVELVTSSGKPYCRGGGKGCLCFPNKIPAGARALKIMVWGAGGASTAFYCEACMMPFLEQCKKVLDEV